MSNIYAISWRALKVRQAPGVGQFERRACSNGFAHDRPHEDHEHAWREGDGSGQVLEAILPHLMTVPRAGVSSSFRQGIEKSTVDDGRCAAARRISLGDARAC